MLVAAVLNCVLNDFRQFAEVVGVKFHGLDMSGGAAWLHKKYSCKAALLVNWFYKCQSIQLAFDPLHVGFHLRHHVAEISLGHIALGNPQLDLIHAPIELEQTIVQSVGQCC